jgi:hypothetical protein
VRALQQRDNLTCIGKMQIYSSKDGSIRMRLKHLGPSVAAEKLRCAQHQSFRIKICVVEIEAGLISWGPAIWDLNVLVKHQFTFY